MTKELYICYLCKGNGMMEKAIRCDFCNGAGAMGEFEGELYPLEDIFPVQIVDVTCPVCKGSGEQLIEVDSEEDLS